MTREAAIAGFKKLFDMDPPSEWSTDKIVKAIESKQQMTIQFPDYEPFRRHLDALEVLQGSLPIGAYRTEIEVFINKWADVYR